VIKVKKPKFVGFIVLTSIMALSFLVVLAFACSNNQQGTNADFGYNLNVWNVGFTLIQGNSYNIHSSHSAYIYNLTDGNLEVAYRFDLRVYRDNGDGEADPQDDTLIDWDGDGSGWKTLAPQGQAGYSVYESRSFFINRNLDLNFNYWCVGTTEANDENGVDAPTAQCIDWR